jgi:hypothetical protein
VGGDKGVGHADRLGGKMVQ